MKNLKERQTEKITDMNNKQCEAENENLWREDAGNIFSITDIQINDF